jgi:ketosteroid isomerase-like protein
MPSDRDTFERFLFSMIGGHYDEAAACLADDVVWHLPPFAGESPIAGKAAVVKFMREVPALFYAPGSMRIAPVMLAVEDGRAACLAELTARTTSGAPYENRYAFFARIADGVLHEVWELLDTVRFQAQTRG